MTSNSPHCSDPPGQLIELPAYLDLAFANELKIRLQESLEAEGALILDAGEVESVTTPCIQVILAAENSASASSRRIFLRSASDSFRQAFEDLGFDEKLGKWRI